MLNQTTARAALAAFDGLLGAHTTSVHSWTPGNAILASNASITMN
jgi:hypothetical protein